MGKSIGIDLGTTNSAAAYYDREVRVLPTRMNEPLTPSVVSYRKSRRESRPGQILVGRAAVSNARLAPEDTIFSIKRLMGRTVDEPKVEEVQERFGYAIVSSDDPEDRGVRVLLNGVEYTPIDVSAMILRQIKEDAERALGEEVTHAVITVPAYFEERQRAATREAGQQAGLVVKKIIDEPTAAAVAFGIDKAEERHRVLVYDMGGGTFDISLIQMVNKQFQVLAIEGDMWLGGDDFDHEIVKAIEERIKAEYDGFDPSGDERFLMVAKQEAEKAKILLSGQNEVDLLIPGITSAPNVGLVDVDMVITRQEFNDMIQKYVDHSMDLVRKVLRDQELGVGDITAVLVVGGATATPLVHQAVTDMFGRDKVKGYIDPMQCVALGAGLLAARIKVIECPNPDCEAENTEDAMTCGRCGHSLVGARVRGDVSVGAVTAKSLGISVVRDGAPDTYAVIIPKGTPYPLHRPMERTFYTTAENIIKVPVYEGEETLATKNDLQGVIEYPLPEDIPVGTPVSVRFDYDQDRVLKVTVWVHGRSDLKKEQTLARDRPRAAFEKEDEAEEEWREMLEGTINASRHFQSQYSRYLDPGTASKMEADIQRAERAFAEGNKIEGSRVVNALHRTIMGSGVASQLFIAERAMDGLGPEAATLLREAVRKLRTAHEAGDGEEVERISMALQLAVARIFQRRASQTDVPDQDFGGLLKDLGR